jgi:CheY-like chemotaxis protein
MSQAAGPSRKESTAAIPPSSINILIVDDNHANRCAFDVLLEHLGYSISMAASGEEALALVTRLRFACILMDVRMPMMDGIETALCLRKKPFSRYTPIIFVSAHESTAREVSQFPLEGPIGYIHSPVDSDLLVWKLKSAVELHLQKELLRLHAASAWHAQDQFRKCLEATTPSPSELRQLGLRLSASLQGLRSTLAEHLDMPGD